MVVVGGNNTKGNMAVDVDIFHRTTIGFESFRLSIVTKMTRMLSPTTTDFGNSTTNAKPSATRSTNHRAKLPSY